jgi:deoxyribonuclease V
VVNCGLEVASAPGRYAAVDVYYPSGGGAVAALVVAADLAFASVVVERVVGLAEVEPYRPGAFFRRELPALRAVLADAGRIDLLVVDGYVHLDPHGRPGLGAHAHAEFAVPVIGVAKTPFRGATHAIEVHRGGASRPLYVTALGIEAERAATLVRRMGGPYRLPDALRRVDTLSRTSSITATPTTAES